MARLEESRDALRPPQAQLDRLPLRGPKGVREELHLAATAQNLRKLAKLLQNGPQTSRVKGEPPSANPPRHGWTQTADFFDGIGPIAGVWNIWFRELRKADRYYIFKI